MKAAMVFRVLVILWMIVIFFRSAKPADQSSMESQFVGQIVGRIFVPDFEKLDESEQRSFAEGIDHAVRKTAHATEYGILAVLIMLSFYPVSDPKHCCIAIGICLLYAVSDEVHQEFVPGRTGKVTDVIIDSLGAVLGTLFYLAALKTAALIGKHKK